MDKTPIFNEVPIYLGPVASIFWLDEELGSDIFLDGIVTLVDAKHCIMQVYKDFSIHELFFIHSLIFITYFVLEKMGLI